MNTELERTLAFHSMHVQGSPLILPNAWDVASARVVLAAGARVLGALRADTVRTLVNATTLPLNVAFGPGTLSISELAGAGASRISAGSSIAEAAYSVAQHWASAMFDNSDAVVASPPTLGWGALNGLVRD